MADIDDPIFRQYIESDDIAMAEASKIAYAHELNVNANPETANEETQKLINERFTEPHFLMPTFSNENVITIERPNKEYIMAVRGTRPTNVNDLAADAQILINDKNNIRVNSVKEVYKSFRAEEPTAKLTLTGHSLGAHVAHELANQYGERYVGFNTPSSPIALVETAINLRTKPIQTITTKAISALSDKITNKHAQHKIYLTQNLDVISSLNKYTNFEDTIISIPQKQETLHQWTGSHNIDNFTRSGLQEASRTRNLAQPFRKVGFKPKIVKTKRGLNTYYSTPNEEAVRRSYNSSSHIDEFENCFPGAPYEKCNKINKKVDIYK
jgi:predicted esterase YcpF (UPF0227 family)